ncbi:MAG TPA: 6-pyruvoyl-tetrahydropterin synthase-related protein [Patescibacteria group bacterium]|nr:6-pyruvoyl-tetrahydropterin synthase-related protein [Patescibacteria group bacterium]
MDREWLLTAYYGFSHQFRNGELYPRWIPTLFNGFGGAFFFIYPPFAYYVTTVVAMLSPVSLSLEHQLGVGYAVLLIASGLTANIWLRNNASAHTAAVGAILYMILPYHLFVDLYSRGALAEFSVYIWLPLTFLYVEKISDRSPRAPLCFAVSYGLLILSHFPTAVYTSPFLLLYSILLGSIERPAKERIKYFATTYLGMVLGAALVAIYMLPSLTLLGYLRTDFLWAGHFHYSNWLLCLHNCYDPFLVRTSLIALSQSLFALGLGALVTRTVGGRANLKNLFWIFMPLAVLFLMSPAAMFIWKIATPLQKIQFPWRMLTLMDVALPYIFVRAVEDAGSVTLRKDLKETVAILLAAIWLVAGFGSVAAGTMKDTAADLFEPRPRMVERGSSLTGEYIAAGSILTNADLMRMDNVPWVDFKTGKGVAAMKTVGPRRKVIHVKAETPATLQLRVFYFAGWTAYDEKTGQIFPVTASAPWRAIVIEVPAGDRTVILELKTLWQEKVGAAISAATLLSICVYLFATRRRQSKQA